MRKSKPPVGSVTWMDLTVPNAARVREFYEAVTGWRSAPFDMGGYYDYCMNQPGDARTVAGICHARGENATLPAQWLIYITVVDLPASLRRCKRAGGKVLTKTRKLGNGRFAVIEDPAGAVAALFEPA